MGGGQSSSHFSSHKETEMSMYVIAVHMDEK